MSINDKILKLKNVADEFGYIFAFKTMLYNYISVKAHYKVNPYRAYLEKYFSMYFMNIALKYKNSRIEKFDWDGKKIPVWVLWWQGEQNMPELVRKCIQSQKKHLDNRFEHIVLCKDNLDAYISLPKVIKEKFAKGYITVTHLSDIIRVTLLKEYGGVWMDSTLYMTDKLDDHMVDADFYTNKRFFGESNKKSISSGRWSIWFMYAKPYHPLFVFLSDALSKYVNEHDTWAVYLMTDYAVNVAYKLIPSVRISINQIEENNTKVYELQKNLNNPYDEGLFTEICQGTIVHKLTYKIALQETQHSQYTFWHYIKNDRI